jgi:hypothetical protein
MIRRFTLDGDKALEERLALLCENVRQRSCQLVPEDQIEALLLGGGYGRGEGGVLKTTAVDEPYNDLEFYLCLRGNLFANQRKFFHAFHHLGESLSRDAHIEVEFKLASLDKLRREAHTMFFYDLANGHRVILGDRDVLAGLEPDGKDIPLFEATRLLMNRCSGLLFANEKLQHDPFTADDADFIGRNQAKAQLAFGDVVLAAERQYHWSCRTRHEHLQKLSSNAPHLGKIRCHHALGMEFKLHPQKKSGATDAFLPLQMELMQLGLELWLWLESRRLNKHFPSISDYAFSSVRKCPETNAARNFLINGFKCQSAAFSAGKTFRYPRERLLEALPLLLWETPMSPEHLNRIQKNLQTDASTFPELVRAYSQLWQQFN